MTLCQAMAHLLSRDMSRTGKELKKSWKNGPLSFRTTAALRESIWMSSQKKFLSSASQHLPFASAAPSLSGSFSQDLVFNLLLGRHSGCGDQLFHLPWAGDFASVCLSFPPCNKWIQTVPTSDGFCED